MAKRYNKGVALVKHESTAGTFVTPSASTDAVLVENVSLRPAQQNVETNEFTGSFDGRGPLIGGTQIELSFDAYVRGSGVAGVIPDLDELLQSCGLNPTVTMTAITATTISISGASGIADSGSGLAALTVGTVIFVTGFSNSNNNGEFVVTVSAAGALTVTKADGSAAGLTAESAGASISIRYGVAGTTAAAGTTTGFTAASPFAATAQLYRGMPILLTGNPATPEFVFCNDYLATRVGRIAKTMGVALSGSTKLSVPANVRYQPHSGTVPASSIELYIDGVLWQLRGMRGSVSLAAPTAGAWKLSFRMMGLFQSYADASIASPTYDSTRPGTFRGSVFSIDRTAASLRTLSLEIANTLQFPPDPNDTEGFVAPDITDRVVSGRMDPHAVAVATRNLFSGMRAGTSYLVHAQLKGGLASVAGNRAGLLIPSALPTGVAPVDADGLLADDVQFFAQGEDAGAQLCFW